MTGYHFSIGYNGATRGDYDSMYVAMKKAVKEICSHPKQIEKEASRLGCPEVCKRGCCELKGYADNYAGDIDSGIHPIRIDDAKMEVMQMASTSCEVKYHVRRAFARLLIEEMHRQCIEVNLSVV